MNSFELFVEKSARSYLQSVVYIDDKIYRQVLNTDMVVVGVPPVRDPFSITQDKNNEEPPAMADELIERNADNLELDDAHPKQLMESFAEMGIVCALYEPSRSTLVNTDSTIFNLCQKADIVVLDWDLFGDGGAKVSELIANLIKQSTAVQPHHVRLCSIYTNQPSLLLLATEMKRRLEEYKCAEVTLNEDKLQLGSGATTISILGKPGVPGRPAAILDSYVVAQRDLAARLLQDFCTMHRGLLSGLALKGLSSIRSNTKRLLDKFSADLDGAFLLHRALVKNDHEALEELPELLAGELSAILEDDLLNGLDCGLLTNEAIDLLPLTPPNDGSEFSEAEIRDKLKTGEVPINNKKAKETLRRYSVMVESSGHTSSEKLSLLFSNRTQYLQVSPSLKFGTVVKHKMNVCDSWEYSICLMPICDSRHRNRTPDADSMAYPFWRLNRELSGSNLAAFFVVDNDSHISLSVGGKIRDKLWLANVKLGEDGWARCGSDALNYEVTSPTGEIHWVAQLKPLHAQRIALHVGTEASRVGVTESEWLRLLLQKSR
jgi:hypothetical protein